MRAEFDQQNLKGLEHLEDQEKAGYACVRLTREKDDLAFYEDGDSIAVGRLIGSGYEYLPRDGGADWNGKPEALMLEKKPEVTGDSVVFILQPAYVDRMEEGSHVVRLIGKDGGLKGKEIQMPVYEISWSLLGSTSALKDYRAEEEERQKAAEAEEKRKAEEKARQQAEDAARRKEAEEAEARRKAAEQAETQAPGEALQQAGTEERPEESVTEPGTPARPVTVPAQAEKKSGKGPLLAGIALVAVLALGGIGFLMFKDKPAADVEKAPQQEEPARAETEKNATEEAAQAEAEKQAAEEAARAEAEKQAAEDATKMRADAKGRVAAFFAGERDPEAAMRLAADLDTETSEQQDAVFRLYYYAAEQDHPQGAVRYAECLDPSRPAWGTVKKDGAEAWYYYGKSPEGENARRELKAWAEQAAQNGDAAAAGWLKEME